MSPREHRRGGLPVGHLDDLEPLEASVVAALRLWQPGDETAGVGVARAMGDLLGLCQHYGCRPLMRHSAGCPCLGADEACLARLVCMATRGEDNDAMLIASLIVRPDVAGGLTRLAQTLGVELGALLDHQSDMPRMTHRPEASHLH